MIEASSLNIALKEWDLVVRSLLAGTQLILLRKGGILEADNQFELEHSRFLFFPTFIHQDPEGIKEAFRGGAVQLREEPEVIRMEGWGEVVKIWEVPGRAEMERLDDLHVWGKKLIDMRFNYRPEKPLYLMAVRAFRLGVSVEIPNTLEYAGCKSWVPLGREISVEGSGQAIEEETLRGIVERIEETLKG